MKRSALGRTPLRRRSQLRTTAPLRRRVRLRPRSAKRIAQALARAALVARVLSERPVCEVCGQERSTEVHEPLSRGRGGSHLDEANTLAVCRRCHHDVIHDHPEEAHRRGLLRHSWEGP